MADTEQSERSDAPRESSSEATESNNAQNEVNDARNSGQTGSGADSFEQSRKDSQQMQHEGTLPSLSIDGGDPSSKVGSSQTGSSQTGSGADRMASAEAGQNSDGRGLGGGEKQQQLQEQQQLELPLAGGNSPSTGGNPTGADQLASQQANKDSKLGPNEQPASNQAASGGHDGPKDQDMKPMSGLDAQREAFNQMPQGPNPMEASSNDFAQSFKALEQSPQWNDPANESKKPEMLNQLANQHLESQGLPPTTVSSKELNGPDGSFRPETGEIFLDPKTIQAGGANLAATLGHEMSHSEQHSLMVLTAQQNMNGQGSFSDKEILNSTSDEYKQRINDARNGRELSPAELERGNKLLNDKFDRSGEQMDAALKEGSLGLHHQLSGGETNSQKLLQSLHDEAGKGQPVHQALLDHPRMSDMKAQAQDGKVTPLSPEAEKARSNDLAETMLDIHMDQLDKEEAMKKAWNRDFYDNYRARLEEKEAFNTGDTIAKKYAR